jgi:diguanylate cyclase (GGDEF)-like protein
MVPPPTDPCGASGPQPGKQVDYDSCFLYYRDQKLLLLEGQRYTVGRSDADILLPHGLVSRHHADIVWREGQFWVVDNGSTNGTLVNGRRIEEQVLLDGDKIKIGCFDLEFVVINGVEQENSEYTLLPSETIMLERRLSRFVGEIDDPGVVRRFYDLKELYDRKKDKLLDFAYKDPLTGLYNRRFFEEKIETEFARCKRYQRQLQLAMLDLDHFKLINDSHGHQKGDEVLRTAAKVLISNSRKMDIPVRYGGEELLLVLPETDAHQAFTVGEKVRTTIAQETAAQTGVCVSVSIGIAGFSATNDSVHGLILAADRMLYAAKTQGRNRTMSDATSPGA